MHTLIELFFSFTFLPIIPESSPKFIIKQIYLFIINIIVIVDPLNKKETFSSISFCIFLNPSTNSFDISSLLLSLDSKFLHLFLLSNINLSTASDTYFEHSLPLTPCPLYNPII